MTLCENAALTIPELDMFAVTYYDVKSVWFQCLRFVLI